MHRMPMHLFIFVSFLLLSGFDITHTIVPRADIVCGGPPKDGIPALMKPAFIKPSEATYLSKTDRVIGVTIHGKSKAYPIKILTWHEAVNDTLGGEPIVVTF